MDGFQSGLREISDKQTERIKSPAKSTQIQMRKKKMNAKNVFLRGIASSPSHTYLPLSSNIRRDGLKTTGFEYANIKFRVQQKRSTGKEYFFTKTTEKRRREREKERAERVLCNTVLLARLVVQWRLETVIQTQTIQIHRN